MSGVRGMNESDLLRLAVAAQLATVHVAFPARVTAYSAEHQTVDVEPVLERATKTLAGDLLREALPIVCGVPIAWPRSGAYGVTFPLAVDDTVLVVVCDRNIGEWRRTGERGDPRDAGVHVLDGAVAIPGLYPRAGVLEEGTGITDHLVLGRLVSGPTVHVDSAQVLLGAGDATQKSVLGTDQQSALDGVLQALDVFVQALDTQISVAGGNVSADATTFRAAIANARTALSNALSNTVRVAP